jgi:hypothetical protein
LRGELHRPAAMMRGCRSHEVGVAARAPHIPVVHSVKHVVHPGRHCAGEVVEVDSPSPTRSLLKACRRCGSGRGVQVTQSGDGSKSARQTAVEQVILQPPAHSSGCVPSAFWCRMAARPPHRVYCPNGAPLYGPDTRAPSAAEIGKRRAERHCSYGTTQQQRTHRA